MIIILFSTLQLVRKFSSIDDHIQVGWCDQVAMPKNNIVCFLKESNPFNCTESGYECMLVNLHLSYEQPSQGSSVFIVHEHYANSKSRSLLSNFLIMNQDYKQITSLVREISQFLSHLELFFIILFPLLLYASIHIKLCPSTIQTTQIRTQA